MAATPQSPAVSTASAEAVFGALASMSIASAPSPPACAAVKDASHFVDTPAPSRWLRPFELELFDEPNGGSGADGSGSLDAKAHSLLARFLVEGEAEDVEAYTSSVRGAVGCSPKGQ